MRRQQQLTGNLPLINLFDGKFSIFGKVVEVHCRIILTKYIMTKALHRFPALFVLMLMAAIKREHQYIN